MSPPSSAAAQNTGEPAVPPVANQPGAQKPSSDPSVTPQPPPDDSILNREERVEYRDQDGNLINEEQLKSLEGKVSFSTRYETRTRVVDAEGHEIGEGSAGAEGFAPPHPDVDREPETAADAPEDDGREYPATASPNDDLNKEKSVEKAKDKKPRPASEGREATK